MWHDADTGKRQDTMREGKLADIWEKERRKLEDAKRKAHKGAYSSEDDGRVAYRDA